MKKRPRVAVTGMGIVSAAGWTLDETWGSLAAGRECLRPLSLFESQRCGKLPVGEVTGDPARRSGLAAGSRSDHLAVWAAGQAYADAGLRADGFAAERGAVVLGALTGGMMFTEEFLVGLFGEKRVDARGLDERACCNATDRVAERFGLGGFRATVSNACASGGSALGLGGDLIAAGEADVVLAGGVDSLNRVVLNGFGSLMLVSPDGCRPFDAERKGMSVGEGSGVLVLESEAHARARGARVRAWLVGCGNTCDAHHVSAPQPEGRGLAEAMRIALADAGLLPAAVDYINAHGTGTADNDPVEARAIRAIFGEMPPAVSSTKRFFGHTLAAAGAIEAIVAVLALERQAIPPNLGLRKVDPKIPLAPVAEYREAELDVAMSTSLGFGGNNSALLFRRAGSREAAT
ncbi:MAG: beta-ketoacyl-[acyl-carrier-protein] synthase family protein [Deltaproteobacteria bacterium]|nr:beta-ketoacyl-[acyl-carrier-protein] synthase family protein [Deltaproteobacteria bacterium]